MWLIIFESLGSRRWNWKFREKQDTEHLLHSSYSIWPWLSTSGSGWDLASPQPRKNVKNVFSIFHIFTRNFNFTVVILMTNEYLNRWRLCPFLQWIWTGYPGPATPNWILLTFWSLPRLYQSNAKRISKWPKIFQAIIFSFKFKNIWIRKLYCFNNFRFYIRLQWINSSFMSIWMH